MHKAFFQETLPVEDPVLAGDDFSKTAKGSNGVVCPD
jgi:hypothetical protein